MLPAKRVKSSAKKQRSAAASQPMCRESPMTKPEFRYYKEVFNTGKNIRDLHSINHIAHEAPAPDPHPRGAAKTSNRGLDAQWTNPNYTDAFTSPAKKSSAAQNQFTTSDMFSPPARSAQKKPSAVKTAEIGGSGTVKPLSYSIAQAQKL